jgi:hypothetical protein
MDNQIINLTELYLRIIKIIDCIQSINERIDILQEFFEQHEESILALQDGLYPLERKSKKLCDNDIHQWEYGLSHTKCSVCDVFCDCDFIPSKKTHGPFDIQACKYCQREKLA